MAITRTPMVDDDGTGTTGTVINNAWKQELYNQIDAALPAATTWTTVPYSASNFSASSGTWTVGAPNVTTFEYVVMGKVMIINFYIASTSVSATPATLRILIPGGYLSARETRGVGQANDAGTATVPGLLRVIPGGNLLECYKTMAGGNWAVATNNTNVAGQLVFSIQ